MREACDAFGLLHSLTFLNIKATLINLLWRAVKLHSYL